MSVDRAQIEHLRSFVATPRCMSYETIRSLGDILDNLEAASAEVAALRRQLEERKSPDMVTVTREDLARAMCRCTGSDPEAHEPGGYPVKDGEDRGEAWHYRWRDFSDTADREFCALRSAQAPAQRGEG